MVFVRYPTALLLLSACYSLLVCGFSDSSTGNSEGAKPKNSILRGGYHPGDHQQNGAYETSNIASSIRHGRVIDDNSAGQDENKEIGNEWETFMPPDERHDEPPERRALNENVFIRSTNAAATASNAAAGGGGGAGGDNIFQHDTAQRTGGVYKYSKGGYYPGPYPPSPTPQWPQWPGPYPPTPTGGSDHRPHYNPRPTRPRPRPRPIVRPRPGPYPRPPGPPGKGQYPRPRPRPRPRPQQRPTRRPNRPQKIPKFCTRCKKKICSKRRKVEFCGTKIGDFEIGCFPKRCKAQRQCSKKCKKFFGRQFCKTRNKCNKICSTFEAIVNCENLIFQPVEYQKCKKQIDNCCCPVLPRTPLVTNNPSAPPSSSPSSSPSALPSPSPSDEPSRVPSSSPSRLPSSSPSDVPSDIPSSSPSANPSISHQPTTSLRPSSSPSFSDPPTTTFMPSQEPSTTPSISPSDEPSLVPSVEPSRLPSSSPSDAPTTIPSVSPSVLPSVIPSHIPSLSPSDAPSHLPSVVPSTSPSQSPSNEPSLLPSSSPSLLPSSEPSDMPSNGPTGNCTQPGFSCTPGNDSCCDALECNFIITSPSTGFYQCGDQRTPSARPSSVPSDAPSVKCTIAAGQSCDINDPIDRCCPREPDGQTTKCQPTGGGSGQCAVTAMPTSVPSDSPSSDPSSEPSLLPSADPSVAPSDEPSFVPSDEPSTLPSTSPSDEPSLVPSTNPSSLPSNQPSLAPSDAPSTMPSVSCTLCSDKLPPGQIGVGRTSCAELFEDVNPEDQTSEIFQNCHGNWHQQVNGNATYCERSCYFTYPDSYPSSPVGDPPERCCPCFTGTEMDVQSQCAAAGLIDLDRACCNGTDACTGWDGNATICSGSCNGLNDCQGLGENVIIDINSCTTDMVTSGLAEACANITGNIGSNSCNGARACANALPSGGYILCDSCNDAGACPAVDGPIGMGSCNGQNACRLAGIVGDGSCNATRACNSSFLIGDGACNGIEACDGAICAGDGQDSCEPGEVCGEDCPSAMPSISSMPSADPSSVPSSMPSSEPSSNPSMSLMPSAEPSSNPSSMPSSIPSSMPSSIPSEMPSSNPSLSLMPSSSPAPSSNPSLSLMPSRSPQPSSEPSKCIPDMSGELTRYSSLCIPNETARPIPDYFNGAGAGNSLQETLNFTDPGLTICSLTVYVAIDKDSIGDLQIEISHDDSGITVPLMSQPGCNNTNPGDCGGCVATNFTYDVNSPQQNEGVYFADSTIGTEGDLIVGDSASCTTSSTIPPTPVSSPVPYYLPIGSLDDFTGLDPFGTWTLTVTDLYTNSNGNDTVGLLDCFAISAVPASLSSF